MGENTFSHTYICVLLFANLLTLFAFDATLRPQTFTWQLWYYITLWVLQGGFRCELYGFTVKHSTAFHLQARLLVPTGTQSF